jgi:catechol 2,3-dioxygenase
MSMSTPDASSTSTLIRGIERVDLRVQDVDRAQEFYGRVAGLVVTDRDGSSVGLSADEGPVILRLDSQGVDAPAEKRATGLFHTAIRYPDRGALGDILARLADRGYQVGVGDHGVSEALYVDDPDGNGVELYRDRPREQWPAPPPGQRVVMVTEPIDLEALYRDGRGEAAVGERAPRGTDVGHVHLQVSELARTTRFYVDALGLDLMTEYGGQAGFYSSYGYHHNIGANVWNSRGQGPAPRNHAGLERVIFDVDDEAALESARERAGAMGARVATGNGEVAIEDPDGIELVFAPR